MFTGIITDTAKLLSKTMHDGIVTFEVQTSYDTQSVELGESIAHNGVCLTVIAIKHDMSSISFDIIPETLDKTNLGEKEVGDVLNLERSLCVGDKLSGHFVQGHIDTTIKIIGIEPRGASRRVVFELPAEYASYIKMKGAVALNGVSLTVSSVEDTTFSVDLIPVTLTETTFGELTVGDTVNFETDMLARYVRD